MSTEDQAAERKRIADLWNAKIAQDPWNGWRALLAGWEIEGHKIGIDPNTPFQGYYRSRKIDKTFEPVHFYFSDGKWAAVYPKRGVAPMTYIEGEKGWDRIIDSWPYIARHPISHKWYQEFCNTGVWPDGGPAVTSEAIQKSNEPTDGETPKAGDNNPPRSEIEELKYQIANAKACIDGIKDIKDDDGLGRAKALKNRLKELENAATAKRDELSRPHLDELAKVRAVWSPVVDDASQAASVVNGFMNTFATAQARARDAAAEKAKATGAAPPQQTQSTRVGTGYGRAGRKVETEVATEITDLAALIEFMTKPKIHSELQQKLLELATRAKGAGFDVPGVKFEKDVKVKG